MGVGGQLHAPAALPPGMTRYPLCRRLGGPQAQSGNFEVVFENITQTSSAVVTIMHRIKFPHLKQDFFFTF
jgi:hypothetical protein